MTDLLITADELLTHRLRAGRLLARIVGTALAVGVGAFLITWLVLAWPTVTANVRWYVEHTQQPPSADQAVTAIPTVTDNHLLIPAITVDAPVFYDTAITDAVGRLPDGVVHVRGTAEPGQAGNSVIVGHSSGYWWQSGSYNQVFALLDKLQSGDDLYVNRSGEIYHYRVTGSQVVAPSNLSVLDQPTDRSALSLVTCTPVGTTLNRLIIHADLVKSG